MIISGTIDNEAAKLAGKPYTLDIDSDFLRIELNHWPVAYSDYVPRLDKHTEYLIVDFDKNGRVVAIGFQGALHEYAKTSWKARASLSWAFLRLGVAIPSKMFSAVANRNAARLLEALPRLDSSDRLPARMMA